jgi:hypothetical protein
MRLGQFGGRLEKRSPVLESERLPPAAMTPRLQDHIFLRQRLGGVSVLVEKIEAKARRDVFLEDADLHSSVLRFQQRPAVRPMRLPLQVIMMFGFGLVRMRLVPVCGVSMLVAMPVRMFMRVHGPFVVMRMGMHMFMLMLVRHMHIKFRPRNGSPLLARDMQVVTIEAQLFQFVFEGVRIDPQVQHGADKHVTADATEDVQVKSFHDDCAASALIWLAA